MATGLHSITSMIVRAAAAALLWSLALGASAQTVRFIHTDALGSVAVVTDQNRNVIERREYEPYGLQLTPAVKDGPGYTGHVQDAVTGLTYMQQRYYDAQIGLFLSVDPVTALDKGDMRHFNRYAYAYNNPYKFTDPDGRIPIGDPNVGDYMTTEDSGRFFELAADGLETVDELAMALPPHMARTERMVAAPLIRGARALAVQAKIANNLAQANKISHIFGQARHNLAGLSKTFGGATKAFKAIEKATTKAVDVSKAGKFEVVVKVGGQNVTVRGAVVEGKVKVGTAFIPPPTPPKNPL